MISFFFLYATFSTQRRKETLETRLLLLSLCLCCYVPAMLYCSHHPSLLRHGTHKASNVFSVLFTLVKWNINGHQQEAFLRDLAVMSLCCKWEPGLCNQACSGYVPYWENMLSYLVSFVRALQGSVCSSVHTVKTRLGLILSQNGPRAWLWTEEARLVKQIYRSHSGEGKTIQVKRVRRGPYRQ